MSQREPVQLCVSLFREKVFFWEITCNGLKVISISNNDSRLWVWIIWLHQRLSSIFGCKAMMVAVIHRNIKCGAKLLEILVKWVTALSTLLTYSQPAKSKSKRQLRVWTKVQQTLHYPALGQQSTSVYELSTIIMWSPQSCRPALCSGTLLHNMLLCVCPLVFCIAESG